MSKPAPVYFLQYNKCPVACYTQAWRVLACMRVMFKEGFSDFDKWKVVRYRISKGSEFINEISVVTDSFLRALRAYGVSS